MNLANFWTHTSGKIAFPLNEKEYIIYGKDGFKLRTKYFEKLHDEDWTQIKKQRSNDKRTI